MPFQRDSHTELLRNIEYMALPVYVALACRLPGTEGIYVVGLSRTRDHLEDRRVEFLRDFPGGFFEIHGPYPVG
jgi:hypothetical protein